MDATGSRQTETQFVESQGGGVLPRPCDSPTNTAPLIIDGSGPLFGSVSVRGAKNAVLPMLVASAMGTEPVTLTNAPTALIDVRTTIDALRFVGCEVVEQDGVVTVLPSTGKVTSLPEELAGRFRYSLLFLGLMLGKHGHAKICLPGGCRLGNRKFDLHVAGLRQLGAEVRVTDETIEASANRLVGTDIHFHLPTTSGTENVMIAACFAEGRTRIFNANSRPEIVDLARCLNAMGANILVRNRVVEVEGRRPLRGCRHHIMSGWDEALLYILAAGMTGGEVCIEDFCLEHIAGDISYLRNAGLDVFEWGGNVYATAKGRRLKAFDLFTAPYPGVNSDMQPLFGAFATRCYGESTITDQRFTERFQYSGELRKLGVPIESYGNCAFVSGPAQLRGAQVTALDIRCGGALILAALAAEGTTVIDKVDQICRGYEYVVPRLQQLGANVRYCNSHSPESRLKAA